MQRPHMRRNSHKPGGYARGFPSALVEVNEAHRRLLFVSFSSLRRGRTALIWALENSPPDPYRTLFGGSPGGGLLMFLNMWLVLQNFEASRWPVRILRIDVRNVERLLRFSGVFHPPKRLIDWLII
jgi:hypothetical protein